MSGPGGVVKSVRNENDAVVVVLTGDVDMGRSVELREKLLEIIAEKPGVVVLNLEEVAFMDSSGLATLVEALQSSRRDGTVFKLAAIKPRVRSIFEISRLDSIFEIYESEAEALA